MKPGHNDPCPCGSIKTYENYNLLEPLTGLPQPDIAGAARESMHRYAVTLMKVKVYPLNQARAAIAKVLQCALLIPGYGSTNSTCIKKQGRPPPLFGTYLLFKFNKKRANSPHIPGGAIHDEIGQYGYRSGDSQDMRLANSRNTSGDLPLAKLSKFFFGYGERFFQS